MTYPITITEFPHQGEPREWVLYSEKHLAECIAAEGRAYREWCYLNGFIEYTTDDDGEDAEITKDESGTLEAYLDWLRHDLKEVVVS